MPDLPPAMIAGAWPESRLVATKCLSKLSSSVWRQYGHFTSPCRAEAAPISNHENQTHLIFTIPCQAASDGRPTVANESEQARKRHQPDPYA